MKKLILGAALCIVGAIVVINFEAEGEVGMVQHTPTFDNPVDSEPSALIKKTPTAPSSQASQGVDVSRPTDDNTIEREDDKNSELNKKVAAALERFKARTRDISADDIAEERQAIEEFRQRARSQTPDQPEVATIVDDNGQGFKKFVFPNGVVRYGL